VVTPISTPWRLVSIAANGQAGERFRLGAVNVLSLRDGQISWIAGFSTPRCSPRLHPLEVPRPDR
jgi:hypothetical protein